MLEIVKGCTVPNSELLSEQYEIEGNRIIANVNASKIEMVFQHFVTMQEERLFFILELPVNEEDEKRLRSDEISPFHKNIYYIDGLDIEQALLILNRYGELLINDGMSGFGFGLHDNSAEIMLYKYNMISLWTNKIDKYEDFFVKHDIPCVDRCFTAWDTFSQETPGICSSIDIEGMSVYDLPKELKNWGIYLAEQREE